MIGTIIIGIGCFILISWGIAHIIPTKRVVEGFGDVIHAWIEPYA